jgi:hypothetical protein
MGKSVAFAKNVGNIAKTMSEKLELEIYNDLDTSIDFKSEEQKLIVTDLKNYATDSALFKRFTGGKQQKASVDKNYNQLNLGLEKGQSGNTTFDDAMSKALQNKPLK